MGRKDRQARREPWHKGSPEALEPGFALLPTREWSVGARVGAQRLKPQAHPHGAGNRGSVDEGKGEVAAEKVGRTGAGGPARRF